MVLPHRPVQLMADSGNLQFPLALRTWRQGDKMIPIGMKGRKKISDMLVDAKIPLHMKNKQLVLLSENEVVWLAGLRASELFKITKNTKNYFAAYIQ